jgi:hypothetical protein
MNTESDTPRTDAQSFRYYNDATGNRDEYVKARFARQLERELNALTSERNNLNASLTAAISSSNARHFESMEHEAKSKQLERELNEANAKIKNPPWCAACKETDCAVSLDGTCAMIRKYQQTLTTETK